MHGDTTLHPAIARRHRRLVARRQLRNRPHPLRSGGAVIGLLLGVLLLLLVSAIGGPIVAGLVAYNHYASGLPDPERLLDIDMPSSTYVYDRTGATLLARFECENREPVNFDALPDIVVDATVAAEDRTFWTNDGIDYQALLRAGLANLEAGTVVQGASTITQQVIKFAGSIAIADAANDPAPSDAGTIEVDPDVVVEEEEESERNICRPPQQTFLQGRSFEDKIREQILAQQVTEAHPGRNGKEQILTTYLNLIFYGNGSYGIKSAAANYFGLTDLEQLSLSQAALLAGLPQLPSVYDPYINDQGPARAMARRDTVLDAMLEEKYISRVQYNEAIATTWEEMGPSRLTSILLEPQFSFRVQREAEEILGAMGIADPALAVRTGGYRIITTLDYELQDEAQRLVAEHVHALNTPAGPDCERCADFNVNNGALVSIDSATGEIVAYIGSVDYYNRDDPRVRGQFDVAGLSRRQPGSAFKPITYASAFVAREATVATMLVDAWTEFGQGEQSYRPSNANIHDQGPMLAADALRYSINIPSVMMQQLVGPGETAAFAEELGIASAEYINSRDPNLTLTLGSVPVNLTNMTQAYGAFAQQGTLYTARTIREIRDRHGRLIYTLEDNGPAAREVMTPAEAYLTHWILEGNTDQNRNVLWGERARLDTADGARRPAGFKTGTTDDFIDVSGFGYVPGSLVTGVWMGNNDSAPMSNEFRGGLFSADGPLYLWQEFMEVALNQPWDWNGAAAVPQTTFAQPEGIEMVNVCRWSGLAATNNCFPQREMPFLAGTEPPVDNLHTRGCLDVDAYLLTLDVPETWRYAAAIWAQRLLTGNTGARSNPADPGNPDTTAYAIAPLPGETGFAPVCYPPAAALVEP